MYNDFQKITKFNDFTEKDVLIVAEVFAEYLKQYIRMQLGILKWTIGDIQTSYE